MTITLRLAAAVSLFCATSLDAGAADTGDPPSLGRLEPAAAERLLSEVVQAVVMAQNCPGHGVGAGEWDLLTGSGDRLAGQLGLGVAEYDRRFLAPAFAALDAPGACGREGPKVPLVVGRLRTLAGG